MSIYKGTLIEQIKDRWIVSYINDDNSNVYVDVQPGRITELKQVGTTFKDGDEVEFKIKHSESFPYIFAIPIVRRVSFNTDAPGPTTPVKSKKIIKKTKYTLFLSGFHISKTEITCEGMDTSERAYFYFYDYDKDSRRKYVGLYPIDKTIIHNIQEIEIEVEDD